MRVLTTAEMRAADRKAIDELGIPAALLMEHAGRAVAEVVLAKAAPGARIAVVCGSGNNGGDGFACARWLREHGRDARVYLARGRPAGGEAALHLGLYEKLGGELASAGAEIAAAGVVVDALLGTGVERPIVGDMADVVAWMNAAPLRVAVDVPSGLSVDTGRAAGAAVRAHATVTLAFPKVGILTWPGCELAGEVWVADIGIPRALGDGARVEWTDAGAAAPLVPRRGPGDHKGTNGHALVIAGSPGKTGAALLAAEAAVRGGAGLTTLATDPACFEAVQGRVREVMTAPLDVDDGALAALLAGKRAVVWGPGMPTAPEAGAFLRRSLARLGVPTVLDADGLNHLAADVAAARAAAGALVLTPHPGEAARLLGRGTADVQADRLAAARALAAATGAVVVLKGARSVVAAPDGRAAINASGNPGLGTGGTGDVLAGLLGALLAQGLAPWDAARLGVYLHGMAGDLAATEVGRIGMSAGDLLPRIPRSADKLAKTRVNPSTGPVYLLPQ
ncbi:MAG TPA: NAD(P)H-hydrate dehydratase [Haliangiales bacterium]|nr:NAD(P)H-hydrate dehydratase [Haliangiales bacterium]